MTPQKTTDETGTGNQSALARIMAQIDKRDLASRIGSLRRARHMSANDLASKAGIHLRCVITLEDGIGVTEPNLRKILSALGAKPRDLLTTV